MGKAVGQRVRGWVVGVSAVALVAGGLAAVPLTLREAADPLLTSASRSRPDPVVPAGVSRGVQELSEPVVDHELVAERTAMSSTWANTNGSVTVRSFAQPQFFQPSATAEFRPIDTQLVRAGDRDSGWWASGDNSWTASFGPADSPLGNQIVSGPGYTVGFSPEGITAGAARPRVAGSVAVYEEMWPQVDVRDQVSSAGVKEDLVLKGPGAPSSFTFTVAGATPAMNNQGGVDLRTGDTLVGAIPPPTVAVNRSLDASAATVSDLLTALAPSTGLSSDAHLSVDGARVTVSVSGEWLARLPESAFPVVIDPYWSPASVSPSPSLSRSSQGGVATGTAQVGFDASGSLWRAAAYFATPIPPVVSEGAPGFQLTSARVSGICSPACTTTHALQGVSVTGLSNGQSASPSFADMAGGELLGMSSGTTALGAFQVADWWRDKAGAWIGLSGNSSGAAAGAGSWVKFPSSNLYMSFDFFQNLPATSLSSPATSAVVSTATPTLTAAAVSVPAGTSAWYDFALATNPDGSGTVTDSGWVTDRTWTVPAGGLTDGVTYYATVRATAQSPLVQPDETGYVPPATPKQAIPIQVKLRLGDGGPSPTDTVGTAPAQASLPSQGSPNPGTPTASETVDLVTGNLALTVALPGTRALAGDVGLTLGYNSSRSSISSGANYGLTGQYFNDPSPSTNSGHAFPSTLSGQRLDPSINYQGMLGKPPIGGISASSLGYYVRWTGYIYLPSGSWKLGGSSTGGMRIRLDGSPVPVYDTWASGPLVSKPTYATNAVAGGHRYRIDVESWETYRNSPSFTTNVQLWVTGAAAGSAGMVVPSTWLSPIASGLPAGWSLSPSALATAWSSLTDAGSQVVVQSARGTTSTFTQNADGSYSAQPGESARLSRSKTGSLQLSTPDNYLYVFNADGTIASVTSAPDDRHPTALQFGYTGAAPQLATVTDPVSSRSNRLIYSGDSACPHASGAPAGMLCAYTTWDGRQTVLTYDGNGQLVAITAPGAQRTLFAYDSDGRLSVIRDGLANDFLASAQAWTPANCSATTTGTDCVLNTTIAYDTAGRVTSITQPQPDAATPRPQRSYTYGGATGSVLIAGQGPDVGYSSKVTYDDQDRILTRASWQQNPTGTGWDTASRPIATVDAAGDQTSTVYDPQGAVTDTFGPAPRACFAGGWPAGSVFPSNLMSGYLPVANPAGTSGCAFTTVPHTHNGYDEDITGLAATYWSNASFAGTAIKHGRGAQNDHANAVPGCDEATRGDWLCSYWGGTPPVPTDNTGAWSVRLIGSITVPTGTSMKLQLVSTGPASLWIDDLDVADQTRVNSGDGYYVAPTIPTLTNGTHRIRIDFTGQTGYPNSFLVAQAAGTQWVDLQNSYLKPDYLLHTSTRDPDGLVTQMAYASADGTIGPELGLQTTVTVDPVGLALTTRTGYESPTATSYLRKTSTTLPAGTITDNAYYSAGAGPIAAVCGVSAGTVQGGMLATQTDPPPTLGQPAKQHQYVYDAAGRVVGHRVGTADTINVTGWACTSYDLRGRITQEIHPASTTEPARTVTYTYGVNGDAMLSQVTDSTTAVTVMTRVDTLGRVSAYVDNGAATLITRNQAGQLTRSIGPRGTLTTTYLPTGAIGTVARLTGSTTTVLATATYETGTGRLAGVAYSNGTQQTITGYDAYGSPSAIKVTNSAGYVMANQTTRTPGGRLTSETTATSALALQNANPAGITATDYSYDSAGRLIDAYLPGQHTSYSYAAGTSQAGCNPNPGANTNRTSSTTQLTGQAATTTQYCYNDADQLTSTTNNAGTTTAGYDTHGNQISDGPTTLDWDTSDRVTAVHTPTGTTTYSYDPLDRLARAQTASSDDRFLYDGYNDSPAATRNAAGATTQAFVNLPGGTTLTISGAGNAWGYADLHGHTVARTTDTGTLLGTRTSYDPWGATLSAPTSGATAAEFAAYAGAGKITDTTTGYIFMGARLYNPTQGRFLTTDPQHGGCANNYVYAHGDPFTQQDITGQACWTSWLGLGLGALSLIAGIAAIPLTGGLSLGLGIGAFVLGGASVGLDAASCFQKGDRVACTGMGLGAVGGIAGGVGLAVSYFGAGAIAEVIADALGVGSALYGGGGLLVDTVGTMKDRGGC